MSLSGLLCIMETQALMLKQKRKIPAWLSKLNAWLHLWLGLSSGIIVFIVALSGTIFVFCDEIIEIANKDALTVNEVKAQKLSPEALLDIFKKEHPERTAFYFLSYKNPQRSFKIGSEDKAETFAFTWLDPYTGKELGSTDLYYFFYVVAHIHSSLLLHEPGSLIVEIATWIFLIELIGGLILWWPSRWSKATRNASFKIKWNGKWRRINYDLHNVLGFYALLPLIMITVTGLIIVNKPLNKMMHSSLDGKMDPYRAIRKFAPEYLPDTAHASLDAIINSLYRSRNATQVRMSIPQKDSVTYYMAIAGNEIGLKSQDGDMMLINRYSGEPVTLPPKLVKGIHLEAFNMNLHLGFWYGWVGKLVTFIAGLIATSLPVTGFIIWWGRRKKNKPAKVAFVKHKKHLSKTFIALFICLCLSTQARQNESSQIAIGYTQSIHSEILKEDRSFWISLPESYNDPKYAKASYPVIYLLDGEANFYSITGIQRYLSKGPYAHIPEMIVVGILNTDRTRDLTPSRAGREAYYDKKAKLFANSGGNSNFIAFLQKELIPHINSSCRSKDYRILVGHSFGGLTAINVLLNHTNLFNAYIAIDPSLWWDNELLLKQAKAVIKNKDFMKRSLFVARANKLITAQDTSTDMQRSNETFAKLLFGDNNASLRWNAKYYAEEDHGTIPIPAAFDGLKFIFKDHLVNVKDAAIQPQLAVDAYKNLSSTLGFIFQPSEPWLSWMADYCKSIDKIMNAQVFIDWKDRLYSPVKSSEDRTGSVPVPK